jgi:NAD(P)-dependent dehydrogenase (short-subunit alcohol dehydrogenase family)
MGIGKAAAECLAREGAAVMIVDIQEESGHNTAAELDSKYGRVAFFRADIARADDDRQAVEEAVRRFGSIEILVNNAGIQTFGGPVDTTEDVWDRTMNSNLKGHWLMSKFAIPHMLKGGKGTIVNVSSVQGLAAQANVVAYVTSKHAMIGLTRAMAVDLAREGIRVNCVCPGTVDTPMIRWIIEQDQEPQRLEKVLNNMHPIGRIGNPREIGEVILFLASGRASFMTGSIVTVDGGLLVPIAGSPNQ